MFASLFNPHSQNLLTRAGIRPNARLVDLGCGEGSMSLWMCRQVGVGGVVFAVDKEIRKLERLEHLAQEQFLGNLVPLHCDAADALDDLNAVDIVYSRFFLMHVCDRAEVLSKILDFISRGGIAIFEEPIIDATSSYPASDLWDKALGAYQALCAKTGVDPNYGRLLAVELETAGFSIDVATQIQPVIHPDFARGYIESALEAHKSEYMQHNILSEDVYHVLLESNKTRDLSAIAYCSFHAVMQVICSSGRKSTESMPFPKHVAATVLS
jgi:ubiquinone/menaquinone biosynthesis C-methylase UbiE